MCVARIDRWERERCGPTNPALSQRTIRDNKGQGRRGKGKSHSNPNPTWIREMGNANQIGAR